MKIVVAFFLFEVITRSYVPTSAAPSSSSTSSFSDGGNSVKVDCTDGNCTLCVNKKCCNPLDALKGGQCCLGTYCIVCSNGGCKTTSQGQSGSSNVMYTGSSGSGSQVSSSSSSQQVTGNGNYNGGTNSINLSGAGQSNSIGDFLTSIQNGQIYERYPNGGFKIVGPGKIIDQSGAGFQAIENGQITNCDKNGRCTIIGPDGIRTVYL